MTNIIQIDDRYYRLLGQGEIIRNGDRFVQHNVVGARWQTVRGYPRRDSCDYASYWKEYTFYREVDILIAEMLKVKEKQ